MDDGDAVATCVNNVQPTNTVAAGANTSFNLRAFNEVLLCAAFALGAQKAFELVIDIINVRAIVDSFIILYFISNNISACSSSSSKWMCYRFSGGKEQ